MIFGQVSAVVLNWNGKDVIVDCLESLFAQTYDAKEIIVVDNGSQDGSLEMIKQRYLSSLTLIENGKNLGFAEGCNRGIRASRGEFIALINSDAALEANWIEEMVKGIRTNDSVGMCACKIYLWGREKILDNTGQVITRDGLGRGRGRLEKDDGQYDSVRDALCPSGCAGLYRREMLEKVGFFDRKFFAYADDIDVGLRGRLLGYQCRFVPTAVAHHRFSASFGALSPLKVFLVERNRLWVLIKCFPPKHLLGSLFHTAARYFYNLYGVCRRKGPAAHYVGNLSFLNLLWIVVKVYLSTLWHLPHLIGERIRIQKKSQANEKMFEAWLRQYGISAREAALNEIS